MLWRFGVFLVLVGTRLVPVYAQYQYPISADRSILLERYLSFPRASWVLIEKAGDVDRAFVQHCRQDRDKTFLRLKNTLYFDTIDSKEYWQSKKLGKASVDYFKTVYKIKQQNRKIIPLNFYYAHYKLPGQKSRVFRKIVALKPLSWGKSRQRIYLDHGWSGKYPLQDQGAFGAFFDSPRRVTDILLPVTKWDRPRTLAEHQNDLLSTQLKQVVWKPVKDPWLCHDACCKVFKGDCKSLFAFTELASEAKLVSQKITCGKVVDPNNERIYTLFCRVEARFSNKAGLAFKETIYYAFCHHTLYQNAWAICRKVHLDLSEPEKQENVQWSELACIRGILP